MAKKPKLPAGEPAELKHNPFAALSLNRAALPEAAPAPPEGALRPVPAAKPGKSRGRLVLRRETKHRGGKAVVIVRGLPAAEADAIAKELKQKLGCGGTVEQDSGEPELVLQGDQPAKVAAWLRAQGFRVDGVTS